MTSNILTTNVIYYSLFQKELFDNKSVVNDVIYEEWKKAKKKSDMADALCMCVDF